MTDKQVGRKTDMSQQWVRWYYYSSSKKMALALNNSERLICFSTMKSKEKFATKKLRKANVIY